MKKGFTLIEMLVVVLIIGILAGVALPQYTSAVRKARVAEAKISLRALIDAEDRYILEHNDYFSSWDDLDIEIQDETNNWTFGQEECLGESKLGCGVYASPKWEGGYYISYWSNNYDDGEALASGKYVCTWLDDNGKKVCKSLGGKQIEGNSNDYQI